MNYDQEFYLKVGIFWSVIIHKTQVRKIASGGLIGDQLPWSWSRRSLINAAASPLCVLRRNVFINCVTMTMHIPLLLRKGKVHPYYVQNRVSDLPLACLSSCQWYDCKKGYVDACHKVCGIDSKRSKIVSSTIDWYWSGLVADVNVEKFCVVITDITMLKNSLKCGKKRSPSWQIQVKMYSLFILFAVML